MSARAAVPATHVHPPNPTLCHRNSSQQRQPTAAHREPQLSRSRYYSVVSGILQRCFVAISYPLPVRESSGKGGCQTARGRAFAFSLAVLHRMNSSISSSPSADRHTTNREPVSKRSTGVVYGCCVCTADRQRGRPRTSVGVVLCDDSLGRPQRILSR